MSISVFVLDLPIRQSQATISLRIHSFSISSHLTANTMLPPIFHSISLLLSALHQPYQQTPPSGRRGSAYDSETRPVLFQHAPAPRIRCFVVSLRLLRSSPISHPRNPSPSPTPVGRG
ncbi:hypothetical protein Hypma_014412 [Hypsizygus marmoreus]|uniref:Uncharacterized protein n=1 Tax=Hypsizygus marmoreus TaxID=39966 RepID=A0A369JCU2_HYPMA|nr:hypothetical protein Hypma_014412 [Hypsizygus marmoreus]